MESNRNVIDRSPSPQRLRSKSFEPQPQPLRLILQEMSTWLPQNKRHCDRRPEIYKRSPIITGPRKLRSPQPQCYQPQKLAPLRSPLPVEICGNRSPPPSRRFHARHPTDRPQTIAKRLHTWSQTIANKRPSKATETDRNPPRAFRVFMKNSPEFG